MQTTGMQRGLTNGGGVYYMYKVMALPRGSSPATRPAWTAARDKPKGVGQGWSEARGLGTMPECY
jgi:hypothetical protein